MARIATSGSLARLNRELTIGGGGLAGLSLGSALRQRGVPVTIVEAGRYPRHRVCGEFISGVSSGTLETLGIARLFDDARRPRSLAWQQGDTILHHTNVPEGSLAISRYVLDARLVRHFENLGGVVRTHERATTKPSEGFVWTAGRRPCRGNWIGLKAHVKGLTLAADLEMHACDNGYAGIIEVEQGWANVCGLFRIDPSIRARATDWLPAYLEAGGNIRLAARLRRCEWRAGSFTAVAGFELGRQRVSPGLLAIGDAESMIAPFTGNGMAMAFQAAEVAVEPLAAWSRGECYWQTAQSTVRGALRKRFRRRLAVAECLHPFLIGARGHAVLQSLAAARVLPFNTMLALVR
jgi:menaquinone-9 beta-reductase